MRGGVKVSTCRCAAYVVFMTRAFVGGEDK